MFRPLDIPDHLYYKLMFFIKNNNKIRDFLKTIIPDSLHAEKVQILKNAIDQNQPDHSIFKDENVLMYLLFLIKNNQIEDDRALTLLMYLMAIKSKHDFEIININDDKNKIFKEKYINRVVERASHKFPLDKNKLNEDITKLEGVDAWIMIVKSPEGSAELGYFRQTTDGTIAFLEVQDVKSMLSFEDKINRYGFSSISIINKIVSQINPNHPIRHFPMFGKVGLETLARLHHAGFHPVPINAGQFVRDNFEDGDYKPFGIILHDLYHTFSGSLLSHEEHVYLYNTFIPELKIQVELIKQFIADQKKDSSKDNFIRILEDFLERLADMDIALYYRNIYIKHNVQKTLFDGWLGLSWSKSIEQFSNPTCVYPIVIKFYHDLFMSSSAPAHLVEFLSNVSSFSHIAKAVKNVLDSKETKFNIKSMEVMCNHMGYFTAKMFLSIIKTSKTAEEFLVKLESDDSAGLYLDLTRLGFVYIPGFSIINDDDFDEMKKLESVFIERDKRERAAGEAYRQSLREKAGPKIITTDAEEIKNTAQNSEKKPGPM